MRNCILIPRHINHSIHTRTEHMRRSVMFIIYDISAGVAFEPNYRLAPSLGDRHIERDVVLYFLQGSRISMHDKQQPAAHAVGRLHISGP